MTGPSVGYPGPKGSHTHVAAGVLAPDSLAVDLPSFRAVVDAASGSEVALGVLPIESSLVGPIAETHDLLFRSSLSIVREATLPIRHCVAGLAGARLDDVKVVRSRPDAFDQCRGLLDGWQVERIPAATTSDAAREVGEAQDPRQVALCSAEAAVQYGLAVLVDDVGDKPGAFTRFVALAPYTRIEGGEQWRTALSVVTDHRPGALFRALQPFADSGVNLVQLVSRPLPDSPWRYRFDIVFDGHIFDGAIRDAVEHVREQAREVRCFGSYPAEAPR